VGLIADGCISWDNPLLGVFAQMLTIPFALVLAMAPPPATPPAPPVTADRAAAYHHFSLAQQARLSGDVAEALEEYRRAQKMDPSSGVIRAETARLLRESGRVAEALVEAEAAVRLDADSPEAHLILAQILHGQAEGAGGEATLRRAATEYEAALRLRPRDATILLILANNVYPQLLEHDKAIAAWNRYLELDPGNFDSYVQLGTQYLAKGDGENAAAALQKAVELQPSSSRAYGALGDIYARAQQTDQAILNYRKALQLDPRSLRLHLAVSEVLFRARRHGEALAEAETVLAADPRNRFALDLQARAFRELRQLDKAAAAADKLLADEPHDVKAGFLRATIDEARRDFKAVAGRLVLLMGRSRKGEDPAEAASTDRVLLVHLGFAYEQLENYPAAAEAFAKAKAATPEPDPTLLGQYVEALVLAKDYDKALAEVRAARAKFADDTGLAAIEANVHRSRGQTEAGVQVVEDLRRRFPKDVAVLADVAEFYQRARKFPDAETVLKSARDLEPRNVRVLFQLGATLERQKKNEAADAVFREALGIEPDSAPVLNYLGYMNADRGFKLDEAVTFIEKAVTLDPENGAYLDSLGWALFRLDKVDQAERYLRRAVEKPGANAVVLDHMGDVLQKRGSRQEALEFWKKALQAEDDGEDLDRPTVERKIREAEAARNDGGTPNRR
jgi:tetratricopeptide (TPR) repeat protein